MLGNPPSLAAFFEIWRQNAGDFLRYEGELGSTRVSYAQAADRAKAFALRLRAEGIAKGDRIVFWGTNRPEWIVALWGAILEGVVVVPIDFRSSVTMVERIAAIVNARALLIGEELPSPTVFCPVWPMHAVLDGRGDAAGVTFEPAAVDDMAEVLFTSGATGEPKGVTLTHRNILANLKPIDHGIEKYRKYMGPFSPIRFLNLLPLSHMFGQSMAAFIPPMIAGEVFFMAGFSPRDAADVIRERRISVLVCVPQMLELLREYIVAAVPDAAEPARSRRWYVNWWQYRRVHRRFGWKFWSFVVGAAPLDPALEEFWRKLGYVVIQGYGLTETAPVATLNHPFETKKGTVGKPIGGVEIRIAPDGEVLLRGENITPGYFGQTDAGIRDTEGWLHTGDIGEMDADKRLKILGRKKEMIVSPDGLNVFPEDVERALHAQKGVQDCAVVAAKQGAREQVHAVLLLEDGADAEAIVSAANNTLEAHQRVRGYSIWPEAELPRTSGTNKLKRGEVAKWVAGAAPAASSAGESSLEEVLAKYAGGRAVSANSSLDELGLSSLDRIQLLMDIEQRTGTRIDETQLAGAKTIADLTRLQPATAHAEQEEFEFPSWSRGLAARVVRRIMLPLLILPLTRLFAWIRTSGCENLAGLDGPCIFAANHQSHLDAPSILWSLPSKWRYRLSPAMSKEFFDAHFHPERHSKGEYLTNSLNYFLASLVFNAFPLPQRSAGTRDALRYAGTLTGEGYSILIFPEGVRTKQGEIHRFMPGVGMLAAKLHLPVVPVRLDGLERVLHSDARMATPGRARVVFGKPLRFDGTDYAAFAKQIEDAVRAL